MVIDETGKRHGKLVVIIRTANNRFGSARWICKCDCGNETIVEGASLRNGRTKSCGCLVKETRHKLPLGEASFNRLFSRMKRDAKKRNYEFDISKEKVKKITKQPCFYCGVLPSSRIKRDGNGNYIYNGIDRMDNTKGYIEGNVVPCCKTCNIAKRAMTITEFFAWIKRVYEHTLQKDIDL